MKANKEMKVPRGTERARRRVGLQLAYGSTYAMLPAKNPPKVLSSTYSVVWNPETLKTLAAAKQAKLAKDGRVIRSAVEAVGGAVMQDHAHKVDWRAQKKVKKERNGGNRANN